ncbi:MAG: hypothetical protein R3261_01320, partial [Alphaproteobacteria bacterium]|nr:hypothetical protein [Alphaproteobacteria bacterium]
RIFGKILVGDQKQGKLFELDMNSFDEDGDEQTRVVTTAIIQANGKNVAQDELTVEFESGVGTGSGRGQDPTCMLRWSDDGGQTWSNEITASLGKIGHYGWKTTFHMLGSFDRRIYEISVSDPIKFVLMSLNSQENIGV